MCLNALEKITSNVDIILLLFNLLDLEDQFRLSRVSAQFKEVFETFLWKQRFTTLRVTVRHTYFIINNETGINRLYLSNNEFKEFQRSYAADVLDLTIRIPVPASIPTEMWILACDGSEYKGRRGPTLSREELDLRLFRHVAKLSCHHILVEVNFLNLIAQCCPNLTELNLVKFNHVLRYDDFVRSLQRMNNLKRLSVKTFQPLPMEFKHFAQIVATNSLEHLQLSYNIDISRIIVDTQQTLTLSTRLKDLKIRTCCGGGNRHWLNNFSTYLGRFEHLSSLHVKLSSAVSGGCIAIIAESCKLLEKLTLKYAKFRGLQTFVVPPQLTELTLNWCTGLTSDNLRQILTHVQLRKFCSKNTNYVGAYQGFCVSPNMLYVSIDDINTHLLKPAVVGNERVHLQELAWFQHKKPRVMDAGSALAAWVNLETLHVRDCHIAFSTIRQLTKLKKVILPTRPPHLNWSLVIDLLTHPSLNELILKFPEHDDIMDISYDKKGRVSDEGGKCTIEVDDEGIRTNLRRLQLSLEIFEDNKEFWLHLFRHNDKLSQMCLICQVGENIQNAVRRLICGDKFPKFLKTIDICGNTMNCKKFRRNFNDVMAKLQNQINDSDLWTEEETYRITLQRSC